MKPGFEASQLAVMGFSQGACLTSETVLRNPRPYGFVGFLSGGAIGPPGTPRDYQGSLAERASSSAVPTRMRIFRSPG